MRPGHHKRLPNHVMGLILIALIAVGAYLAFARELPWSHGYEIQAVFTTAENVRPKIPVRIAGVEVGEVTDVQPCTNDNSACGGVDGGDTVTASTNGPSPGQGGAGEVKPRLPSRGLPPEIENASRRRASAPRRPASILRAHPPPS